MRTRTSAGLTEINLMLKEINTNKKGCPVEGRDRKWKVANHNKEIHLFQWRKWNM